MSASPSATDRWALSAFHPPLATRLVAVRVPAGTLRAIARNVPAGTSASAAKRAPRAAPRSEVGVLRLTSDPASAVVNRRRFGVSRRRSGRRIRTLFVMAMAGAPRGVRGGYITWTWCSAGYVTHYNRRRPHQIPAAAACGHREPYGPRRGRCAVGRREPVIAGAVNECQHAV